MDSLAAVLRRIPLFTGLPRGSLAKVIADLREEYFPAGAAICYEGQPARDFYVIKAGKVAVFVDRSGGQREKVATCGVGDWFGERALFSSAARSATVVATEPTSVWRLNKEKFDGLLEENPRLIWHFTEVLSDRLYQANQDLSHWQSAWVEHLREAWARTPTATQRFLLEVSVLPVLDPVVVAAYLGEETLPALESLEHEGRFVARTTCGLTIPEPVQAFLLGEAQRRWGRETVALRQRQAASLYESASRVGSAIQVDRAGDTADEARRVWELRPDATTEETGQTVTAQPDLADRGLRLNAQTSPLNGGAAGAEALAAALARPARPGGRVRWVVLGIGVLLALSLWSSPPPTGLSVDAMRMLATLAVAASLWATSFLPDYVVGLALVTSWMLLGLVPPAVAVSGFTADAFFLVVGVLGMGASLQASGLLFRMALQVLRLFPLSHRGQCAGLALSGTAMAPAVPDVTSGLTMAAPVVLAVSDSLGYPRRSNASAGLAMAALLGFGQMSPFFLTGAAENLLAWSTLTQMGRHEVGWLSWCVGAAVLGVATFALAFAGTLRLLPAEQEPTSSRNLVETQLEALGPMSRAEWINALVLGGAVGGWITAPYHGVGVGWVSMAALVLLLALDLLDRPGFRTGIYWDLLFYLGAVLSLSEVVRHLAIDQWVVAALAPMLVPLAASPGVFLLVVALAVFVARFVLPSLLLVSLFALSLLPIVLAAGMHPLPVLLVICMSSAVWFLPYQSPYYLALYFGTKEKAFTHEQVRRLAWTYALVFLAAIACSIPYWYLLGWLPY